jgi:membrane associated rhomboid family serine protease
MSRRTDPISFLLRSGSVFSYLLIATFVAWFLVFFLASGGSGAAALALAMSWESQAAFREPWTFLTYSLVNLSPVAVLFECVAVYFFLAPLERSWGIARTAGFFGVAVAAFPLAAWLGAAVLGKNFLLSSAALPVTAAIVAWAARSPGATILLFAVLPLKAVWVAIGASVLAVLSIAYGTPLMAPFLAAPLGLAWPYAAGRLRAPSSGAPKRRRAVEGDYEGIDWNKRREAESERRRLKELFERSWGESDDDR